MVFVNFRIFSFMAFLRLSVQMYKKVYKKFKYIGANTFISIFFSTRDYIIFLILFDCYTGRSDDRVGPVKRKSLVTN